MYQNSTTIEEPGAGTAKIMHKGRKQLLRAERFDIFCGQRSANVCPSTV